MTEEAIAEEITSEEQESSKPLEKTAVHSIPLAQFKGEPVSKLPQDLYIPPQALEIFLEAFEGPLDLLLYLIKRNNMDILDIQVAEITHQYMKYVSLMEAAQFELAAEYLVMAATLAEIKSRMLLPRVTEGSDEEEEDPRAELIRRLQEYERFKQAAEDIDQLPRTERDIFPTCGIDSPDFDIVRPLPQVDLKEVLMAMAHVLRQSDRNENHQIQEEVLSVRERMSHVLAQLSCDRFIPFVALFRQNEGKIGVVVTFMAIMELIKGSLVELVQNEPFGPIHVKAKNHEEYAMDDDTLITDASPSDHDTIDENDKESLEEPGEVDGITA
ncbi:Segregation and condensation protein A [invertebrate metagenome]|uniref:Segregation and condensation protein A n=1 Tax=invertebrate metagenome TaxID=1711999 RepID=A0A2H9TAL6_9ZZZZ